MRFVLWSLALVMCVTVTASAQTQNGEWRAYSGDRGSMKYAPLDQIDRTNVKNLRIVWRRPAVDPLLINKDPKLQVSNNFRATPLMVNGVLYSPNNVLRGGEWLNPTTIVPPRFARLNFTLFY